MTTTEMNKASKMGLITYIAQLQESEAKAKQELSNAIGIANYFGSIITFIEKLLVDSPFISKEGKFIKKLIWIIANFGAIVKLIEEIFAKIKEWRTKMDEIIKQQQEAQAQFNPA